MIKIMPKKQKMFLSGRYIEKSNAFVKKTHLKPLTINREKKNL